MHTLAFVTCSQIYCFCTLTIPKRKKTSFLMGELSKKKHKASTAMRVSLDLADMRASVDAKESQVVSFSGEKTLADKTRGKIG